MQAFLFVHATSEKSGELLAKYVQICYFCRAYNTIKTDT